ncbi:fibronectin type III domain-containing protein 5 isoform X2 [Clupea harengus]|uniref:Fibronectin type III domain-containing protein 5 isoform X2 n=1 Tax=Clupea harengus TaxID=7950 RepID=A0A8M1KVR4_CLUHA|nr:fibronectin type III domain-containing protein 5 isoform X2 [Clupea harengus]
MEENGFNAALLFLGYLSVSSADADTLSAPLNVTIELKGVNSALVTWEIFEGDPVIGFAITQQKKDLRMLRFIQEVNTTTRSCALWDLDEDTEYIVHVQSISMSGTSPPSDTVVFRTPKESERLASKSPGCIIKVPRLSPGGHHRSRMLVFRYSAISFFFFFIAPVL